MLTVAQSGTLTLPAIYKNGVGALVDPSATSVDILAPDGSVVVDGDPLVRDSVGVYHYDFDVPATAALGIWTARFFGTISGADVEGEEEFEVVVVGTVVFSSDNMLISLEEYKTAAGIPADVTRNDARLRQAIAFASVAIRNYTDRDFATTEDVSATTRLYPYDGSGFLDVDDLVAGTVEEVALDGVVLDPNVYVVQPQDPGSLVQTWIELPPDYFGMSPEMGFTFNLDRYPASARARLPLVSVTARFGWLEVPGDVKQAAVWTATAFAENPEPWSSKSVADYSVTLNNSATSPIPERAQILLDYYVRYRMGAA